MACAALLVADGPVRPISPEEAAAYAGPGFVWSHIERLEEADRDTLKRFGDIPEIALNALVATETRPRCDRIEDGAIINIRGPASTAEAGTDRLVSIRCWVRAGKINSLTRSPMTATEEVRALVEQGGILDPGDLVAALARAVSKQLDPQVADLGDLLDTCEVELEPRQVYRLRTTIARVRSEAISFRRFVAPDRDALQSLAGMDFEWLAEEDRLHIREAADRFARMAEELEAVRERAALLHEQITDLRSEQIDARSLLISVVAFIFLPLTFVTGLLGMNVAGIPYADEPWAFSAVLVLCLVLGLLVLAWFLMAHWLRRG